MAITGVGGKVLKAGQAQPAVGSPEPRVSPGGRPAAGAAGADSPAGALQEVRALHLKQTGRVLRRATAAPLRSLRVQVFIEIFSGSGHLASAVSKLGGPVLLWDMTLGAEYDLTVPQNQSKLRG